MKCKEMTFGLSEKLVMTDPSKSTFEFGCEESPDVGTQKTYRTTGMNRLLQ